jgi:hypothetical protein
MARPRIAGRYVASGVSIGDETEGGCCYVSIFDVVLLILEHFLVKVAI